MEPEWIRIDGSVGEGGGQILRTALALSILTGRPFRMENIRAGRSKPGLRPQHLACVRAARVISRASVEGEEKSSTDLTFAPRHLLPGSYRFDVGTGGSVTLLAQSILLPLALADGPSVLTLIGGTHVPFAPTYEYFAQVYVPLLERMGVRCNLHLEQLGFWRQGGGQIRIEIDPVERLQPLRIENRGFLLAIRGVSIVNNLASHIARRQAESAEAALPKAADIQRLRRNDGEEPGTAITLWAEFDHSLAGASALGEIKKRAERVGQEPADELETFLGSEAGLDVHASDQMLLPCAIADGTSCFRPLERSQHFETNRHTIDQFLPVTWSETPTGLIEIGGVPSFESESP